MSATVKEIAEALERLVVPSSRSHTSTSEEKFLGGEIAATNGFDTLDLFTAILEAEGLGADTEERRKIAVVLAWPVSDALHRKFIGGYKDGFAACRAQVTQRLFG